MYLIYRVFLALLLAPSLPAWSTEAGFSASEFFVPTDVRLKRPASWPDHVSFEPQVLSLADWNEALIGTWESNFACDGAPAEAHKLAQLAAANLMDGVINPGLLFSFLGEGKAERSLKPPLSIARNLSFKGAANFPAEPHVFDQYRIAKTDKGGIQLIIGDGFVQTLRALKIKQTGEFVIDVSTPDFDVFSESVCGPARPLRAIWIRVPTS